LVEGESGSEVLARELIEFVQPKLAKQKWPRSVDFVDLIARGETGKVYRRKIRDAYWENESRKI
jgi:acyl-CoA synthetase (AMP-forming)/AMP-acid ligase II